MSLKGGVLLKRHLRFHLDELKDELVMHTSLNTRLPNQVYEHHLLNYYLAS